MCGNLDDARDLTQETFLQAIRSIRSFQQKSSFYTWLFRIAVNLCLSHLRKAGRTPKLSLHAGDGDAVLERPADDMQIQPVARASAREIEAMVMAELDHLDEEHRAVIVLRDVEGFDYQQIAEILDVAVGTVKSRLHRGRCVLRKRLRHLV
jgi:RNA polymerase sigma-70 factor (ECF subfamily)